MIISLDKSAYYFRKSYWRIAPKDVDDFIAHCPRKAYKIVCAASIANKQKVKNEIPFYNEIKAEFKMLA